MDETPVMRVAVGTDPNTQVVGYQLPGSVRQADYKTFKLRWDAAHNGSASEAEGRPIFDKVLMLTLLYPGTSDQLDVEIKRFPDGAKPIVTDRGRYEMFKDSIDRFEANGNASESGTPLALINLDPATIANLNGMGIKTVEQLSDVPDSALDSLKTGGRGLRDRARAFIEASAGGAPMARLQAENEGLRGDVQELKRRLDEFAEERRVEKVAIAEGDAPSDAQPKKGK